MTTTAQSEAPPPVGFKFEPRDVAVERSRQRTKLSHCGVDPDLWGDVADPTFFAFFTIMAQRWSGRSINGNVHMTQVYRLASALPLDAPLTMTGVVSRIDPHPRGSVVHADFAFRDMAGKEPMTASRSSLNPGPGDASAPRNALAARSLDTMGEISRTTLVPDRVAAFSDEAENLIHSDPATAKRFGFRAPIAGGLMASHIMLGALIEEAGGAGGVTALNGEIAFLRPMFWDERLRVFASDVKDAGPRFLALVGDDDKPRCRATIDSITFG